MRYSIIRYAYVDNHLQDKHSVKKIRSRESKKVGSPQVTTDEAQQVHTSSPAQMGCCIVEYDRFQHK